MIVQFFGSRINEGVRNQFQQDFEFQVKGKMQGHSHGESAANRTSAANSIKRWIGSAGFVPYYVSKSSRDEAFDGFHQVFMAKDVLHPPCDDDIGPNHVIVMMDVDYYLDMDYWISFGRPIVLYTFVPIAVAGTTADGHYTIIGNNIKYRANGGAEYYHPLWDYSADLMLFRHWFSTSVCTIESRHVAPDRRVFLITPEYTVRWPFSWVLATTGKILRRAKFDYAHGLDTKGEMAVVNRLEFTRPDSGELFVSIGIAGQYSAATFSSILLDGLMVRYHSAKHPDMITTSHFLKNEKVENSSQVAPIFWDCLQVMNTSYRFNKAYLPAGGQQPKATPDNYVAIGDEKDGFLLEDTKPKIHGRNVAPPLVVHPDVVPAASENNDWACLQGRVFTVYNRKVISGQLLDYLQEFAEMLIPADMVGTLEPMSLNDLASKQRDPTKRKKYQEGIAWALLAEQQQVKAFCKRETYAKITAPRNISQFSTSHVLTLGSFIDVFTMAILVPQPWYAGCKPPSVVADRVMEIAAGEDQLIETDQSRFDGHISIAFAKFTRGLLARAFKPEYRKVIYDLCNSEILAKAKTTAGIDYRLMGGRGSGSKATTAFNTEIIGGGDFCCLRRDGYPKEQAWDRLGLYAGDDSISRASPNSIHSVWTELGFKVKAVIRQRGDQVGFLGRYFIDPWETNWSMQAPLRTWGKLHISFAPAMLSDSQALVNRARGYLDLDPTTPIISDWCHTVLRLNQTTANSDLTDNEQRAGDVDVPWWTKVGREYNSGGWPCAPIGHYLPVQRIAELTGFESSAILGWQDTIRDCQDLEQLRGLIPNEPTPIELPYLFVTGNDPFRIDHSRQSLDQAIVDPRDLPTARDIKRQLDTQSVTPSDSVSRSNNSRLSAGSGSKRGNRGRGVQKRSTPKGAGGSKASKQTGGQETNRQTARQISRLAKRFGEALAAGGVASSSGFQPHSPINTPPPVD